VKTQREDKPINLSPETVARCNGPEQFQNFDRMFRSVIAVPKEKIVKEETKWKRKQARKRADKPL